MPKMLLRIRDKHLNLYKFPSARNYSVGDCGLWQRVEQFKGSNLSVSVATVDWPDVEARLVSRRPADRSP